MLFSYIWYIVPISIWNKPEFDEGLIGCVNMGWYCATCIDVLEEKNKQNPPKAPKPTKWLVVDVFDPKFKK